MNRLPPKDNVGEVYECIKVDNFLRATLQKLSLPSRLNGTQVIAQYLYVQP